MFTARQSLEAEPCNYCREPATVFFSLNPEATPDICPACFVTALGFAEPDAETFTLLPKRSPARAALPARAPDPDLQPGDLSESNLAGIRAVLTAVGAPRLPEPSPLSIPTPEEFASKPAADSAHVLFEAGRGDRYLMQSEASGGCGYFVIRYVRRLEYAWLEYQTFPLSPEGEGPCDHCGESYPRRVVRARYICFGCYENAPHVCVPDGTDAGASASEPYFCKCGRVLGAVDGGGTRPEPLSDEQLIDAYVAGCNAENALTNAEMSPQNVNRGVAAAIRAALGGGTRPPEPPSFDQHVAAKIATLEAKHDARDRSNEKGVVDPEPPR